MQPRTGMLPALTVKLQLLTVKAATNLAANRPVCNFDSAVIFALLSVARKSYSTGPSSLAKSMGNLGPRLTENRTGRGAGLLRWTRPRLGPGLAVEVFNY